MNLSAHANVSEASESSASERFVTALDREHSYPSAEVPRPVCVHAQDRTTPGPAQWSGTSTFRVGAASIPTLVRGRWNVEELLGEGAYGKVFGATDTQSGKKVAVKVEESGTWRMETLQTEFDIYSRLKSIEDHIVGLPRCLFYGRITQGHKALVMEKLGKSLRYIKQRCRDGRMSLKTVITLAAQGVRRLEQLHHIGYVHRDIKPDNMLVGEDDASRMYLVDFGLAVKYLDEQGNHVPKTACKIRGTPLYCSLNTHLGILPSRRCDLESLGYVLVDLARGNLPWRCASCVSEIYGIKVEASLSRLCRGLGHEFEEYLIYVRGLKYDEKPDYKYLGGLFKGAMERHGYSRDRVMDWTRGRASGAAAGPSNHAGRP